MATINKIHARQILDSRGIPTVEVKLLMDNGYTVSSSVPSGTSTGKYEAVEIRDGDQSRYFGMEVTKAVANINETIAPKLVGMDPANQGEIDQVLVNLDGTENKSNLGVNAILPVSQVCCKAGALVYNLHLFDYIGQKYGLRTSTFATPIVNVINGGKHGAGNLDFQEFSIIPTRSKPYPEALRLAVEIYHQLEISLTQMNAIHSVGIEGGYAPNLFTNKDALEIIIESVKNTDYTFGKDVFLGLDVAAAHFYKDGKYQIKDRQSALSASEILEFYKELNNTINLFSIEDGFIEDDWKSWAQLTADVEQNTIILGDDLLAGNKDRLLKAIQEKACNAILLKPNQIGTITEAVEIIKIAKEASFTIVVSHRSGETNDDFISDFAIGVGADYTKFGAPSRGERTAKYNRLLDIYQLLYSEATQTPTTSQAESADPATQMAEQPQPVTQPGA